MKVVLQRVLKADCKVDGKITGQIEKGYVVFLGVGAQDTKEDCDRLVKKIINLRIFSDENDKINLSLKDVNGGLLIISQFTLYADCSHGNRPNFIQAGKPQMAEELYNYFTLQCKKEVPVVQNGIFGASMQISLINDGPFTIELE